MLGTGTPSATPCTWESQPATVVTTANIRSAFDADARFSNTCLPRISINMWRALSGFGRVNENFIKATDLQARVNDADLAIDERLAETIVKHSTLDNPTDAEWLVTMFTMSESGRSRQGVLDVFGFRNGFVGLAEDGLQKDPLDWG